MIFHLLNGNLSLDTADEQKNSDAEIIQYEVINAFTQTDFNKSSETEASTNHTFSALRGSFTNPEIFAHRPVTHYFSLKLDVDDEYSAKK